MSHIPQSSAQVAQINDLPNPLARHNNRGTPTKREDVSATATDCATVNSLEQYYGLLNCQAQGVVSHADGFSVSPLKFPSWVGWDKKECSTSVLDTTLHNLANMARSKGHQVSCESAVVPSNRVLQVERELPFRMKKGFQLVASTNNTDKLF